MSGGRGTDRTGGARCTVVPGIGGSDDRHWQSRWQDDEPAWVRTAPASWDAPDEADWLRAMDVAADRQGAPAVVVAHSLGCLAATRWATEHPHRVAGLFLVAPPDRDGPRFPAAAASFRDAVAEVLPVPTLMVTSTDDPYCTPEAAAHLAERWGATSIVAGRLGHLNSDSALGDWPCGRALLTAFVAGLGPATPAGG